MNPPPREERRTVPRTGIPLRAVVPNAVTALALCVGLSGVRFAIAGEWESAIMMIIAAMLTLVLALGIMAWVDWPLALVAVAPAPIVSFVVVVFGRFVKEICKGSDV